MELEDARDLRGDNFDGLVGSSMSFEGLVVTFTAFGGLVGACESFKGLGGALASFAGLVDGRLDFEGLAGLWVGVSGLCAIGLSSTIFSGTTLVTRASALSMSLFLTIAATGAFMGVDVGFVAIVATTDLFAPVETGLATFALVDASGRLGAVVLLVGVDVPSFRLSAVVEVASLGGLRVLRLAFIEDILLETPLRVGRLGASLSPDRTVSLSESPLLDFDRVRLDVGLLGGLLRVLPSNLDDVVDARKEGVEVDAVEDLVGPVARDATGFVVVLAVVLPSLGGGRPRSPIGVALAAFSFEFIIACPAHSLREFLQETFEKRRTFRMSRGFRILGVLVCFNFQCVPCFDCPQDSPPRPVWTLR